MALREGDVKGEPVDSGQWTVDSRQRNVDNRGRTAAWFDGLTTP